MRTRSCWTAVPSASAKLSFPAGAVAGVRLERLTAINISN
jgi:hypothetical protein